jgi:hypothetical protein
MPNPAPTESAFPVPLCAAFLPGVQSSEEEGIRTVREIFSSYFDAPQLDHLCHT